jgi:hypothetical protein
MDGDTDSMIDGDLAEPLSILTMDLDPVARGGSYEQQLSARGGVLPIAWDLLEGPEWLEMDDDGRLRADDVPGPPAEHPVTVRATDDVGAEATGNYTLTVTEECANACDDPRAPQQQMDCSCACGETDRCGADELCCGDTCADTQIDAAHCGACGQACPAPDNSTAACNEGACAINCNDGYADCDRDPANGCEANLGADPHCGSCDNDCSIYVYPNGEVICAEGQCQHRCDPNYDDCDGNEANGCESDLRIDTENCGACRTPCPELQSTTRACDDRVCRQECPGRFWDCDGNPGNGCEAELGTVNHCDGCGDVCNFGQGISAGRGGCIGGECRITLCVHPHLNCDGIPENGCEHNSRETCRGCDGGGCEAPRLCDGEGSCCLVAGNICSENNDCCSGVCFGMLGPGGGLKFCFAP